MSEDGDNQYQRSSSPSGDLAARTKVYPLSSRRLTLPHLKTLATALGIPTAAAAEDIRLMIGGKLLDMDKEQQNVEVVRVDPPPESSGGGSIGLRDEQGIFIEVDCVLATVTSPAAISLDEDDGELSDVASEGTRGAFEETEHLTRQELLECRAELAETRVTLEAEMQKSRLLESDLLSTAREVSALKESYESEREKTRRAWKLHCEQLARWDAELADGDAEIARLKAKIVEFECEKRLEHEKRVSFVLPATLSSPSARAGDSVVTTAADSAYTPAFSSASYFRHSLVHNPVSSSVSPFAYPVSSSGFNFAHPVSSSGFHFVHPAVSPSVFPFAHSSVTDPPFPFPSHAVLPPRFPVVTSTVKTAPTVSSVSGVSTYPYMPTSSNVPHHSILSPAEPVLPIQSDKAPRRGKAPPVDPFTGENSEIQFDDWLPTLSRAVTWNRWTDEESLMQLAALARQGTD